MNPAAATLGMVDCLPEAVEVGSEESQLLLGFMERFIALTGRVVCMEGPLFPFKELFSSLPLLKRRSRTMMS